MKGGEEEEDLGKKLARIRKGSSRRGGPTVATPVLSSWSFQARQQKQTRTKDGVLLTSCVSARKLGAALWEFHNYYYYSYLPLSSEMHRSNGAPPPPTLLARQQHRRHVSKDKGTLDLSNFLADDHQPESASSLTRRISASLMLHNRPIGRNNGDSPAVTPSPTGSLEFKRRIGKSHCNLKTSTELLRVLNRIWSLEEQHTSNVAVIRALKAELDHARVMMKDLVRERQADRHELDDLMNNQTGEDKQVRKSKKQDRIHSALQSVRDELEDERRLIKRSESLHRKLARDLSEVKSSLSDSLIELESERKSRKFLEELCDEFAKGIKEYEQKVHILKQNSDKDQAGGSDRDRLILHISESWLDERMQVQLEPSECGLPENESVVEKLSHEIETLLHAKHKNNTPESIGSLLPRDRWKSSMESVLMNEVVSAPQDAGDEDSSSSDSNFFELNKPSNADSKLHAEEAVEDRTDEMVKSDHLKKKSAFSERVRSRSLCSLQVKFEEQMAWALICSDNKKSQMLKSEKGKSEEVKQQCEATEDETYKRGNPSYIVRNHIRNHLLISDSDQVRPENNFNEASCSNSGWMNLNLNQASPVKPWTGKVTSPGLGASGTSSKLPLRKKENSLKAKLLEARSKGPRST